MDSEGKPELSREWLRRVTEMEMEMEMKMEMERKEQLWSWSGSCVQCAAVLCRGRSTAAP
jgi:hypothetical protein